MHYCQSLLFSSPLFEQLICPFSWNRALLIQRRAHVQVLQSFVWKQDWGFGNELAHMNTPLDHVGLCPRASANQQRSTRWVTFTAMWWKPWQYCLQRHWRCSRWCEPHLQECTWQLVRRCHPARYGNIHNRYAYSYWYWWRCDCWVHPACMHINFSCTLANDFSFAKISLVKLQYLEVLLKVLFVAGKMNLCHSFFTVFLAVAKMHKAGMSCLIELLCKQLCQGVSAQKQGW